MENEARTANALNNFFKCFSPNKINIYLLTCMYNNSKKGEFYEKNPKIR